MAKVRLLAGQRQKGERLTAVQACNDWLRLGRGRSLPKLLETYTAIHQDTPPTQSIDTLKRWSSRYDWRERASEYDAELEQQKNERRRKIMDSGLALDFERTDELKRLAHFLIDQIYEQGEDGTYHNVWLPDVKQIGSGEYAERVDIERFNAAILDQLRGALDDLAKEKGDRRKKADVVVGLDDSTRQLFVQIGALAASCITDPAQKDAFMKNLQEMMNA